MYETKHWVFFKESKFAPQGTFGRSPKRWAMQHQLHDLATRLPDYILSRHEVRSYCQQPQCDLKTGYAMVMAWGQQGARGGSRPVHAALEAWPLIEKALQMTRSGAVNRQQAYDLFDVQIPGLRAAYFTKLIYYFLPDTLPMGYIMDQWTGKSANLITATKLVKFDAQVVSARNDSFNYEAFCKFVDGIAAELSLTGDEAEQKLFCRNKKDPRKQGPWRAYVAANWGQPQT